MDKFLVFSVCLIALFGFVTPISDYDAEVLYEPLSARNFEMPPDCKSQNMAYCFNSTDYPYDIVEELLKDLPNLEVANDDEVYQYSPYGDREGSPDDEDDCRSQSTTAPIYYIVDESGRDRVVVQMEGRFEQRYSVMWCDKEGAVKSRTRHFLESTVKDNNISCENKYMDYDFLVLSLKPDLLGKWKLERARTKTGIPVCCACKYVKK